MVTRTDLYIARPVTASRTWTPVRCAIVVLHALAFAGCGADPGSTSSVAHEGDPVDTAGIDPPAGSLRMTIDGREWVADSALFGAVHPPGYDRAVLIAGSLGPKDRNEQAFNINLYGVDAPGIIAVVSGQSGMNVAQLANPRPPTQFLAGGVLGHDMTVELIDFSSSPTRIEARFSGTLTANDGAVLQIRDGSFTYADPAPP